MNLLEREIERLEQALENGEMSQQDFQCEMKYLRQDVRDRAEDAAQEAYEQEMNRW